MRKSTLATVYAVLCTILFIAGLVVGFIFAWWTSLEAILENLIGFAVSLFLVPLFHELGHVAFAEGQKMRVIYTKFFCFKVTVKNRKSRLHLASPFAPEQTQAIPKSGGNMQKRAKWYTLGGVIFGGMFLFFVLAAAIVCTVLGVTKYSLWGFVPYAAYLLLLNVMPLEYPSGKTDMLVYIGFKKGYDTEKNMLAAMEIQGQLYEGKSFSEIEESLYFDVPQLSEDEPLFAVMLDLRYRYYLEKQELKKAAGCLNRLASVQEYLSAEEARKIAAELVYMHSLNGDFERAEKCGKYCKEYLSEETVAAKRILAAYSSAFGKSEVVGALKEQAESLFAAELMEGVAKFEKILLLRIAAA